MEVSKKSMLPTCGRLKYVLSVLLLDTRLQNVTRFQMGTQAVSTEKQNLSGNTHNIQGRKYGDVIERVEPQKKNVSAWKEVISEKKATNVEPSISKLTKSNECGTSDGNGKNRYSALEELAEGESEEDSETVCEEGEYQQVSDLLSKAFSKHDGGFENLHEACAGKQNSVQNGIHSMQYEDSMERQCNNSANLCSTVSNSKGKGLANSEVNVECNVDVLELNQNCDNSEDAQEECLDSFLHGNFNCLDDEMIAAASKPKNVKVSTRNYEKGVRETLESLRVEIESGKLDSFLCSEKTKLMEIMTKNYNTMDIYAKEREKEGLIDVGAPKASASPTFKPGFLNYGSKIGTKKESPLKPISPPQEKVPMNPGPYDHIKAPPGFKAPPMDSFPSSPTASSSRRKSGTAPITRSKKLEMMREISDDKG